MGENLAADAAGEIRRAPDEILPGGRVKSVLRTGEIDSDESVDLSRQSFSGGGMGGCRFRANGGHI